MRLTWGEYLDYEDPAWQDRKKDLEQMWRSFSKEAAGFDTDRLLDYLEQLEELLRYYTFTQDFGKLEPLMRYYEPLLHILEDRKPDRAGYWYLEMEYARINGMLYLDQGENREAAQYYEQALFQSGNCFSCLQREEESYSAKQRLYLAWACVECGNEAAGVYERLLDASQAYQIFRKVLPFLHYVETCSEEDTGIIEKAADVYFKMAPMCYQWGDAETGNSCYEKGEEIYGRLAKTHGSDYYCSRRLWGRSNHGIDAFVHCGDERIMLSCEKEIRQFLEGDVWGHDRAMAQGALAMACRQQSALIQQSGDLEGAIRKSEEGVDLFDKALHILEAESQEENRIVVKNLLAEISGQLYGSRIAALEVLGVQYYQAERYEEACKRLEQVLAGLADSGDYRIPEGPSLLLRAESCEYLALIAAEDGDGQKVEFYASQAIAFGERAAKGNQNIAAWELVVLSASLAAEAADRSRERQKAGNFARQGLAACEELARLLPDSHMLALQANLAKWEKKANRRFF